MDTLTQLNEVFSRWEKKGGPPVGGGVASGAGGGAYQNGGNQYNKMLNEGRQVWNKRFQEAGIAPPTYRRTRQKHRNGRNGDIAIPTANVSN